MTILSLQHFWKYLKIWIPQSASQWGLYYEKFGKVAQKSFNFEPLVLNIACYQIISFFGATVPSGLLYYFVNMFDNVIPPSWVKIILNSEFYSWNRRRTILNYMLYYLMHYNSTILTMDWSPETQISNLEVFFATLHFVNFLKKLSI